MCPQYKKDIKGIRTSPKDSSKVGERFIECDVWEVVENTWFVQLREEEMEDWPHCPPGLAH